MKLTKIIKRIFCSHEYLLVGWHWTHGPNGSDPRMIEAKWKCRKCGKVNFFYPARGSEREKWFENTQKDKRDKRA